MFSFVVDVAIGLIFVYLLLSLMCSAANEIIELWLKKRAIDLERGIREMLAPGSGSGSEDIVEKLYDHALINNLFDTSYKKSGIKNPLRYVWRTHLPSYIPARSFALALMDLVKPAAAAGASGATGATPATNFELNLTQPPAAPPAPGTDNNPLTPLRQGIATSDLLKPVPDVQRGLLALVDAAGNDVAKARENIENWFNNSMDRVSGWYKRRTQLAILILGLLLTVAMNVDSLTIVKKLSTDKALRDSLVAASVEYAKAHASPEPIQTPGDQTKPEAGATASPSPKPTATPTPCPSPAPTPVQTNLPDVCKDLKSAECTKALPGIIPECKDLNSEACKTKTDLLSSCLKDPKSQECKQARVLFEIPECITDKDSAACKQKTLLASIPACNECKPGKDPKESPQCKFEFNQRELESLNLPIGWDSASNVPGGWPAQLQLHWLGWLLTTLAISLGAPFWFDLLNKFIVIRSAVKPHEKSPEEESKD